MPKLDHKRLGVLNTILYWALSMAAPSSSSGQTICYVDKNSTGPAHDGTSWCTAYTELQTALNGNQPSICSVIYVADGAYRPTTTATRIAFFQLESGVRIYGGYAGCGAPDPNARDLVAFRTILSGDLLGNDGPGFTNNAENSYHVVSGGGADATAILDGFTITGGNANGPNPSDRGGGIWNYFNAGGPTIRNCIIHGNAASMRGGGVYNDFTTARYLNCIISGNMSGNYGGGMYNSGVDVTISVTNCTIVGNSAFDVGGMYNSGPSRPIIRNTILWDNEDPQNTLESSQINPGFGRVDMAYSTVQGLTRQFFRGAGLSAADPLFVDADGPDGLFGTNDDDCHLLPGSPAVNTGDPAPPPLLPPEDLDLLPRHIGCRVDRGVFETDTLQDFGDFDADFAVTLSDYRFYLLCFPGPLGNPAWDTACECLFDANASDSVDKADLPPLLSVWDAPN